MSISTPVRCAGLEPRTQERKLPGSGRAPRGPMLRKAVSTLVGPGALAGAWRGLAGLGTSRGMAAVAQDTYNVPEGHRNSRWARMTGSSRNKWTLAFLAVSGDGTTASGGQTLSHVAARAAPPQHGRARPQAHEPFMRSILLHRGSLQAGRRHLQHFSGPTTGPHSAAGHPGPRRGGPHGVSALQLQWVG